MSRVANRYAKALFALARERGTLEETAAQLDRLGAIAADAGVAPVLRNPLLSPSRRRALAETLGRDVSAAEMLSHFLGVLADHQRLGELPFIAEDYQRLLDNAVGRVRIAVRTAQPLEPAQLERISSTFAQLTGKRVVATVAVDPELLGGVVVAVEGKVYDGSVRTRLERIARGLAGSAL